MHHSNYALHPLGITDVLDEGSTLRDLRPLLLAFSGPPDREVRALVDERWPEVLSELTARDDDEDVVVLISDDEWTPGGLPFRSEHVLPRSVAVALALPVDVRVADWLARRRRTGPRLDVIVEVRGELRAMLVSLESAEEFANDAAE
jgi:hypothetical protein